VLKELVVARQESEAELWERLWGTYIAKLNRVDDLMRRGRYGYQLRMPLKAVQIAKKALLDRFPEADKYVL
jgi:hypothetical protein